MYPARGHQAYVCSIPGPHTKTGARAHEAPGTLVSSGTTTAFADASLECVQASSRINPRPPPWFQLRGTTVDFRSFQSQQNWHESRLLAMAIEPCP